MEGLLIRDGWYSHRMGGILIGCRFISLGVEGLVSYWVTGFLLMVGGPHKE